VTFQLREQENGRFRVSIRVFVPAVVTLLLSWYTLAFVAGSIDNFTSGGVISSLLIQLLFRWLPVLLVAVWLVLALDTQPLRAYGFDLSRRWVRDLFVGVLLSLAAFGLAWAVGYQRGTIALESEFQPQFETTLFWFVIAIAMIHFLIQNVYEEFIYRGLMIRGFTEGARDSGLSIRMAVLVATVSSLLLFGLYHVPRGFIFVVDSIFVGIAFAVPYLLTGSLALSIGVHFGRFSTNLWSLETGTADRVCWKMSD